ncbi:MAG: hypothetical protein U5Q16_01750 [Gammaproteobacteria bacterium]|nr:hypothetical protein [Gammaproteobacteria bacterium]
MLRQRPGAEIATFRFSIVYLGLLFLALVIVSLIRRPAAGQASGGAEQEHMEFERGMGAGGQAAQTRERQ